MSEAFAVEHWLRLSLSDALGDKAIQMLLREFESPKEILAQPESRLATVVPKKIATRITARDEKRDAQVKKTLRWLEEDSHHIVTIADTDYPELLLNISEVSSPPTLLYVDGRRDILKHRLFAIVGARSASEVGKKNATVFAETLARSGLVIASGMAAGIDTAAHSGALAASGGLTVAVLGCGVDIVYPRNNRQLASDIAATGALISEFPLGTPPIAGNFPHRNRIISGISEGCMVAEATLRSGSLITAKFALNQGRDVFAVPGSINSPLYQGCHRLIKDGAYLIETANDILEHLKITPQVASTSRAKAQDAIPSSGECDHVARILAGTDYQQATSVDDICARCALPVGQVLPVLLELELSGRVVNTGGGYQRVE